MFRRPSKRQLFIQRVIVYAIMVISILVIVAGAILFVLGYRLDGNNGRLEQGALVQFESTPSGALVSIDGTTLLSRTSTKQSLLAGAHTFTYSRDGYESWTKTLELKAGTLTWLDYARLIPKTLEPKSVASYATAVDALASPDQRMLAVQEKKDTPIFQVVNVAAADVRSSTVTVPADLYSAAGAADTSHTFELRSWDKAGRYLLVTHRYNDSTEWLMVDTQDVATSVNVTRLLSLDLTDARFSGTSGNVLFGLTRDGVVRKLDLSAATISRGLVTRVSSFDVYDVNIITYIGQDASDPTKKVAGIYRDGDESAHVIRTAQNADAPLLVTTARYYGDDYVVVAEGVKVIVFKGTYPASSDQNTDSLPVFAEFTAPSTVDSLSFNVRGNFIVAQSDLSITSYEVEHQRKTEAIIGTSETTAHTLKWLDDEAYLWSVADGHLSIREFDGSNVHVINPAEPGFDAVLTPDGKYLYSMTKAADGIYQLQRVTLIL
jgi:hypothetical protein